MSLPADNCALGERCTCTLNESYWKCENWAKSSLAFPRIGHGDAHYGIMTREQAKRHAEKLHKRGEKQQRWLKQTDERLGTVRRSDPRAHLRKKGIKI